MNVVESSLIALVIIALLFFFIGAGKVVWHMHRAHQYDKRANEAWERDRE